MDQAKSKSIGAPGIKLNQMCSKRKHPVNMAQVKAILSKFDKKLSQSKRLPTQDEVEAGV